MISKEAEALCKIINRGKYYISEFKWKREYSFEDDCVQTQEANMWRTLIYYKPEYIDMAMKLRENYIAHQKEVDIVSEEKQDDIEYARGKQYDEAVFIEDPNTVIIHEMKSGYTKRCPISDVYYQYLSKYRTTETGE